MKQIYRDCEIEVSSERALGGWDDVYWSAFTVAEGYELTSGFGGGSVAEMEKVMRENVDFFWDDCGGDFDRWESER